VRIPPLLEIFCGNDPIEDQEYINTFFGLKIGWKKKNIYIYIYIYIYILWEVGLFRLIKEKLYIVRSEIV